MTPTLTIFQGRVGDHNDRGFGGAAGIGAEWQRRLGLPAVTVGNPEPPLNAGWQEELAAAVPALEAMSRRYDEIYAAGETPVAAMTRCAVALATLPVVARYHPDALVVWFDAHGDLNTPDSSTTGYLGGLALSGPMGMWESGLGSGIAAAIGDRPVYFHLDCDVLEPGLVPTDYRVPNGITLDELSRVATRLAANSVVGIEVAEFEGSWSDTGASGDPDPLLTALSPLMDG